jgi:dephospho-CoA kinase
VNDGRPLAVLVGGAPGFGKTTLATALSDELMLPHLNKDNLVHGVWRTQRRASELGVVGVELFYATNGIYGVPTIHDLDQPTGHA